MKDQELVNALRRLRVETGSLACMGCGHEHNCGVSGCAIINEAVARITMLDESFGEGSVLKMAAAVLETTPEELLQSTRFQTGDTVWVLMRDEDDVPCDIGGYMFLAFAGTAVIVTAFIGDHDDLDGTLAYHIEETAVNFDSDLSVFPIPDCYASREDAQAALDAVASRESQLKEKRKS